MFDVTAGDNSCHGDAGNNDDRADKAGNAGLCRNNGAGQSESKI